ncbi:DUF3017 domain-containing protein [Streptomyces pyxinae]|uniref:DUF3017 domain-containing protein n=1 Tax=Streptomyces pyxinae TaxID=2970734 RepID=UPI003D16FE06
MVSDDPASGRPASDDRASDRPVSEATASPDGPVPFDPASDRPLSEGSAPGGSAPDAPGPEGPVSDGLAPGGGPSDGGSSEDSGAGAGRTRRPPTLTRDTARPEGGGRAAAGDAPAPARQWPLLTVLGMTGLGLLVVGWDPFAEASRIGAILIGVALLTGAVLRRTVASVGMLAVRSRFTDMATYGVLGGGIVLLSLMTQPHPWLEVPFLEEAVHFAVR